jgi:hypothetical protein
MPRVRYEPTIPVFDWAITFCALDRASTVIGRVYITGRKYILGVSAESTVDDICTEYKKFQEDGRQMNDEEHDGSYYSRNDCRYSIKPTFPNFPATTL